MAAAEHARDRGEPDEMQSVPHDGVLDEMAERQRRSMTQKRDLHRAAMLALGQTNHARPRLSCWRPA
ncbi:MAG: hypothetical protein FJ265_00765 [Planctomycetes bacterium]|nr:hypothetical protein [Planctomycetota bacterium]